MDDEEEYCSCSEDEAHCCHWWDGEDCCRCGDPAMTEEEMREQGMIE